jgi:Icc-related predicted phosphoesterase
MIEKERTKRLVASIGDIHVSRNDKGRWAHLFRELSGKADVLVICGDLTDTGDEAEAHILAEEFRACTIPVVAVLGNHDHEKGHHKSIRGILQQNENIHVLDGESVVVGGVGFAGVKGFGGGFDNFMLSYFGEAEMKAFVQEAINQSLQLDRALAQLDRHKEVSKIAVMHYAPVSATVLGEPEAIFPFLGSSRLEEPLNKRKVFAALHGHAHAGTHHGTTSEGINVYNVADHVLRKAGITTPFFMLEV